MRKLESIYKAMKWDDVEYISTSMLTSKNNKDSRTFCLLPKEDTLTALKRIFSIKDCNFDEKFRQACSGSGQEERRIATLHSSSLCALLFFYNVTKEHPLKLYVEGVGDVMFCDVLFEYQNCVIGKTNPSNMDVTLLGEYNGKKVILFLESKFSEYIIGTQKKLKIKKAYLHEELSKNLYEKWPWNKEVREDEENFFVSVTEDDVYLGGLKQMISHYVGVRKFERGLHKLRNRQSAGKDLYDVKDNPNKQAMQLKLREFALDGNVIIVLGSILFDVYGNDKEHSEMHNYEELYTKLMAQISEDAIQCSSDVLVLTKFYTYQEIFKDKKDWSTKAIYKFYFPCLC